MKTDINWDGQQIKIRPSSVDNFYGCSFQWAKVFLEGARTIPNGRAAVGTAVHKGVEEMWKEAMLRQSKDQVNVSMATDAAIQEFQEQDSSEEIAYDTGENANTCEELVKDGVRVFVEDIVPWVDMPTHVEKYVTMPIDHVVVNELGGTIDYSRPGAISDVKTSKRKPVPQSYTTQQTIYKILEEHNGNKLTEQTIQGVTFVKNPVGHILPLEPNVPRTKFLVNSLLDTLEAFHAGGDPKVLFRGNPKYMFCSSKYCKLYDMGCPYANGDA